MIHADATRSEPDGVSFPSVDGTRSTSATARTVFEAAASVVDTDLAERIRSEQRWHDGYVHHLRDLVAAELQTSGTDADRVPRAGLDSLRARLTFVRDGAEVALASAFDLPARPLPHTAEVQGTAATAAPSLSVPYGGQEVAGGGLVALLDRWSEAGTVEPTFATAIGRVVDEPDWLDLRGHTFVVLGAGAQMGPLEALCRWGATVVPVDLPVPGLWRQLLHTIRSGTGRALVPLHRRPDGDGDDHLAEAAGIDLLTGFPELAAWIEDIDGPLVIGSYVYADGAANVRVTMAADAIVDRVLQRRDDVVVAGLLTPTDVYAAPAEAVAHAQERYARAPLRRRIGRRVTRGRAFAPNYPDTVTAANGARYGLADCLVQQQGPNYALAKRAQRWRLRVARRDGVGVSANIAPATWTRSVTKNRVLAAAYAGAPSYAVEVFAPEASNVLEAALLVRDLRDPTAAGNPEVRLEHPLDLFVEAAAHGGLWRQPYAPRSVLPLAAIRGSVPPRPRAGR